MPGVLEGIRVIDFGQYVAGPLAAVMLADQGADVIHVDPPGGPRWQNAADAFFQRGKRRITLDLKAPDDLDLGKRLIASADVVIENFRPGVMDRLGVGAETMSAANPRLVYCSLPGFSKDDPRANVPGWEGVIDAATENCRLRVGEVPEGWDMSRPTYSAIPVASNFAAFLAGSAIVMALTARHRNGRGQIIEVPLFNAMFEAIGGAAAFPTAAGITPQRPLTVNGGGTYKCGDGRYVQFNPQGSSSRFLTWFCHAAGVSDWAAEGYMDGKRLRGDAALGDRLHNKLVALFATRSAQEWEDLANSVGAPLCMIRTTAEWLQNEHARRSRAVVEVDDPELGPTWMAGFPVHTTQAPGHIAGPRHLPDADRDAIIRELAAMHPAPSAPAAEPDLQRPLDGMRVVDLTQILAGPTSGRMLGEYGADVIKINFPKRNVGSHGFVNRGKETLLVDIESAEGQQVFWKLIETADVITQNFPQGTAERYGIGYDQVKAMKPDIVYVSVSCYGYQGLWGARRGYETQGQAVSGVMERSGGDGFRPTVLGPYNVLDFGTGAIAAFAASLGIYHKVSTGQSEHVQASLAQTGTYQQSAYALDYSGKVWDEPRGPEALGAGPLQRFYQANDGWLFLGAHESDLERISRIPGFGAVEGLAGPTLEGRLEMLFKQRPAAEWVDRLQGAGIGAHQVVRLAELMTDQWVRNHGLSINQVSEEAGEVTMPGLAVSMSATPPRVGHAVRRPGADGTTILTSLGLANRIDELEDAWAVQTSRLPAGW